jgi:hypothetical protein
LTIQNNYAILHKIISLFKKLTWRIPMSENAKVVLMTLLVVAVVVIGYKQYTTCGKESVAANNNQSKRMHLVKKITPKTAPKPVQKSQPVCPEVQPVPKSTAPPVVQPQPKPADPPEEAQPCYNPPPARPLYYPAPPVQNDVMVIVPEQPPITHYYSGPAWQYERWRSRTPRYNGNAFRYQRPGGYAYSRPPQIRGNTRTWSAGGTRNNSQRGRQHR